MTIYGYARVSARDQNLARQLSAFAEYGIPQKNIFADKKSGKNFLRTQYQHLLKHLKGGDLLVIASLDRLGRNYEQILNEWKQITREIGADILVLDMPLLDTRIRSGTLVGKFVADLVLQVLSFLAENERMNIRARQAEGTRLAKARGVRFGRPQRTYSAQFLAVMQAYRQKRISLCDALGQLRLKKSAFYKQLGRLREPR